MSENFFTAKYPISQEKPSRLSSDVFLSLSAFPIPKDAIRYPKATVTNHIHSLINANLISLVPNIDIGYQMDMSASNIFDWIKQAKEYGNLLNTEFQKKCNEQMMKFIKIEDQKERSRDFDIKKIGNLPDDIIRHIHGFLMNETRIELIKARYPNLEKNIMKLKVIDLKILSTNIRNVYYLPVLDKLYKNNRARCLPKNFFMRFGFSNKITCIDNINKLIGTFQNAVAHTPNDYRYFQKKSLKILRALVYTAKTKKVLDKPYAPELEVTVPSKRRKKN